MCKLNNSLKNKQKPKYSAATLLLISIILCCGFSNQAMAVSIGCDDDFVQLNNNELVINVAQTGGDDTANIQCALDEAAFNGFPTVRLDTGTYNISNLVVEDFNGTLEGSTQTSTFIDVLPQSIDCQAMENAGLTSSAIKFVGGTPRIRFMTISAAQPCFADQLSTILHFTGESAFANNCANDVIFGAVDRVILEGFDAETGPFSGVLAIPEGAEFGGCKKTLLGTLKLNRSTVRNTEVGIATGMRSGAQVDINFNEFDSNTIAVLLVDTNQNTTITSNEFFGASSSAGEYISIAVLTEEVDAPNKTRVVIDNNDFNVSSSSGVRSVVIAGIQDGRVANISSVITNNRFFLSGVDTFGVVFGDISNTHVASNLFSGNGAAAVFVGGDTPVTGWTITANNMAGFSSDTVADIHLDANTSQCIIGPAQGAFVNDMGSNNSHLLSTKSKPTSNKSSELSSTDSKIDMGDLHREISQQLAAYKNRLSTSR
jgi:hypothetical protein